MPYHSFFSDRIMKISRARSDMSITDAIAISVSSPEFKYEICDCRRFTKVDMQSLIFFCCCFL